MQNTMHGQEFRRPRTRRGREQKGIAAIGLATMMLLGSGALMVTGYLANQSADANAKLLAQQRDLQWAHDAVTAFASVNGRLPCRAVERNGRENCADGQAKGWLPVETLEGFASAPPGIRDHLDMHYGVFRGNEATASDPDLAKRSDVSQPFLATGKASKDYPTGSTGIVSSLDLCAKLQALAPETLTNRPPSVSGAPRALAMDRLQILGRTPGPFNAAFAISAAAKGAPLPASGVNARNDVLQFESPERSTDAQYADQVAVGDAAQLHAALGCQAVTASLDMMATAYTWVDAAIGKKKDNADDADLLRTLNSIGVSADMLVVLASAITVENALEEEAKAIACYVAWQAVEWVPGAQYPTERARLAMIEKTATVVDVTATLALNTAWMASTTAYLLGGVAFYGAAAQAPVWTDGQLILQSADTRGGK